MKFTSGGRFCIRLSFYLTVTVVTVINMATLFSTDLIRYRQESKQLHHPGDSSAQLQHHLEKLVPEASRGGDGYEKLMRHAKHTVDKQRNLQNKSTRKGIVSGRSFLEDTISLLENQIMQAEVDEPSENPVGNIKTLASAMLEEKDRTERRVTFRGTPVVEKLPNIVEHDLGIEDDPTESKPKNPVQTQSGDKSSKPGKENKAYDHGARKNTTNSQKNIELHNSSNTGYKEKQVNSIHDKKSLQTKSVLAQTNFSDRQSQKQNASLENGNNRNDLSKVSIALRSISNSSHLLHSLNLSRESKQPSQYKIIKTQLSELTGKDRKVAEINSTSRRLRPEKELTFREVGNISCEKVPNDLIGKLQPILKEMSANDLQSTFPWLSKGGHYTPPSCVPKEKTAIIFPFRDRHKHLHILLLNLLPLLKRQNVDFTIFVVEQENSSLFNRGMMFNVGFVEALKHGDYDCFIFHDVDLIPLFDTNFYHCNKNPTHFLGGVNKFKYGLSYRDLFGGVVSFTRSQYERINGASNMYFGWGAEDDDLRKRIERCNMTIIRTDRSVGLYDMIKHRREKSNPANPIRSWLLRSGERRFPFDGLSTLEYQRLSIDVLPLYNWVKVKVDAHQVVMNSKFYTSDADHRKMLDAFTPKMENATAAATSRPKMINN